MPPASGHPVARRRRRACGLRPVALGGRQREPFIGLGDVAIHADAARGQHPKIVLAVGNAVLRGPTEPLCGVGIVRPTINALRVKDRQIVHCLGVTLAGGGLRKVCWADGEILFHPLALFEHAGVTELRRRQPFARRPLIPSGGFVEIGGDAAALDKTHGDFVGGTWIAAHCRVAQRGPPIAAGNPSAAGCVAGGGDLLAAGDRVTEPVTSIFGSGSSGPNGGIAVTGSEFCAA